MRERESAHERERDRERERERERERKRKRDRERDKRGQREIQKEGSIYAGNSQRIRRDEGIWIAEYNLIEKKLGGWKIQRLIESYSTI